MHKIELSFLKKLKRIAVEREIGSGSNFHRIFVIIKHKFKHMEMSKNDFLAIFEYSWFLSSYLIYQIKI